MNIDFSARPGFSAYVVLLIASGLTMVVLASPTVRRQSTLLRLLNGVAGVGFVIYGIYLGFFFRGGHYIIFFKAFILPVALIARTVIGATRQPARQNVTSYPPVAPGPHMPWQDNAGRAMPPLAPSAPPPPPHYVEDNSGWLSAPVRNGQPVIAPTTPTISDPGSGRTPEAVVPGSPAEALRREG